MFVSIWIERNGNTTWGRDKSNKLQFYGTLWWVQIISLFSRNITQFNDQLELQQIPGCQKRTMLSVFTTNIDQFNDILHLQ
jgi:hypothetical protein